MVSRSVPNASPAAPTRGRAPVRDFTASAPAFAVEWHVRPAFDFLFALSGDSGSTDDLPTADREWLSTALAAQPASTKTFFAGPHRRESLVHLAGFLVDRPDVRRSADLVPAMRAAGPGPVFANLFYDPAADPGEVDRAFAGDAEAAAAMVARIQHGKHGKGKKGSWVTDILADPAGQLGLVLDVLGSWAETFAGVEDRVSSILKRDYDLHAVDRATLGPVELVERTTNGIRIESDPTIQRVILAPSYFARPFNYLLGGPGWRLAGYPVADEALELDPLSPPSAVLRLHRALGDATRLRILKLLADRDLYGTELAEQLDISKPTVSHHMAQLRAAGLVTAVQAGSATYYSLRRERIGEALGDLTSFLVG
jgi:DNA-binding transcriptional ArsR family regulator